MAMTEQQINLVISAQNGDIKSFGELYGIYNGKIYALARMILKNQNDAEDILQETFINALRKLNTLDNPATFSVWIQVIARNLCTDQLKRKNIFILLDAENEIENFDDEESDELLPAIYSEKADLKERLGRIINGLSDVQRQAIVFYYFNEMSVPEIASVMECSEGTVKSRLFLARKTIRAEIKEEERKKGEKFYGIVGIPMLSFGKLIHAHFEATSISPSASATTLSTITESISGNTNTASAVKNKEDIMDTETKKKSAKGKVITIIVVIAALGIAVALIFSFVLGNNKPDTPNDNSDPGISATAPGDTSGSESTPSATQAGSETPGGEEWEPGALIMSVDLYNMEDKWERISSDVSPFTYKTQYKDIRYEPTAIYFGSNKLKDGQTPREFAQKYMENYAKKRGASKPIFTDISDITITNRFGTEFPALEYTVITERGEFARVNIIVKDGYAYIIECVTMQEYFEAVNDEFTEILDTLELI